MDWRTHLATLIEALERVPAPKWAGSAAILLALVLLVALGMVAAGNWSLRRRLIAYGSTIRSRIGDTLSPTSLRQ